MNATALPDLYATLGVPADATAGDIRTAYRRNAKVHHPDVGGDPGVFAAVSAAYDVLSDSHDRAMYDVERSLAQHRSAATSPGYDPAAKQQASKQRPTPTPSSTPPQRPQSTADKPARSVADALELYFGPLRRSNIRYAMFAGVGTALAVAVVVLLQRLGATPAVASGNALSWWRPVVAGAAAMLFAWSRTGAWPTRRRGVTWRAAAIVAVVAAMAAFPAPTVVAFAGVVILAFT